MTSSVETSTSAASPDLPEAGIGDRIRQLREGLGLSQSQFHLRTKAADPEGKGIARTVLIGYEAGKFKPGARELRVLCQACDASPAWLLFGDSAKAKPEDDLDAAASMLLGGLHGAGLSALFGLALTLGCLKSHERQAIATLVHGLASSRRGWPTASTLSNLASVMALDVEQRMQAVVGEADVVKLLDELKGAKGAKRLEDMHELYLRLLATPDD